MQWKSAIRLFPKGPGPWNVISTEGGSALLDVIYNPIHPHPTPLERFFIKGLPLVFYVISVHFSVFSTPFHPHNHQWGTPKPPKHPTPQFTIMKEPELGAQFTLWHHSLSILRIILFIYPEQARCLRRNTYFKMRYKTTQTTYDFIFFFNISRQCSQLILIVVLHCLLKKVRLIYASFLHFLNVLVLGQTDTDKTSKFDPHTPNNLNYDNDNSIGWNILPHASYEIRKSMYLVVHIACFRFKQSLFVAYSQFHNRYWLKAALEKIIP